MTGWRNIDMMAWHHREILFHIRELPMTNLDDRRKGFEAKWAHDADLRFQIEARRNRALGVWAAAAKGLSGQAADDFVVAVIAADFQEAGDEDVFRKLRAELDPSLFPDAVIRSRMAEELDAAVAALAS
jgi:hypothetical protein